MAVPCLCYVPCACQPRTGVRRQYTDLRFKSFATAASAMPPKAPTAMMALQRSRRKNLMIPSRILGLTSVLYILEHQLPQSLLYRHPRHCKTVDDLLIHIVNLLDSRSPRALALGVSGSSSSIMDLTLTFVTRDLVSGSADAVPGMPTLFPSPHL